MPPRILIVTAQPELAKNLAQQIAELGYSPASQAGSDDEALALASGQTINLALLHLDPAHPADAVALATALRTCFGLSTIFLCSAALETGVEHALGAQPGDYLTTPFTQRELHLVLEMTFQRQRAEARLREHEEKYATVLRASMDSFWIVDEQGRILDANESTCRITGFSRAELLQMAVSDLEHEKTPQQIAEGITLALSHGFVQIDRLIRCKDGGLRLIEMRLTKSSGKRLFCFGRDITESHRVEKRLNLLNRAVEQSPASIVITDPSGNIEYVNPYFEKHTGYSQEEVLGGNPKILKSGAQSDAFYKELWETISGGLEWRGEFHNRKKNGTLYWEQASISAVRDESAQIVNFIAVKEDITERKLANEALSQRQSFLTAIIENQPGLVWLKDLVGCFRAVNQRFCEAVGMSAESIIGKTDFEMGFGDHAEIYRAADQQVIQSRTTQIIEEFISVKGELRAHETFKAPVFDTSGEVIGTTGFAYDITSRKASEQKLQQRESSLRAIFECQPGLVWLKDSHGHFLSVNHAFAKACGRANSALVLGLTDFDVWPKELAQLYQADDLNVMRSLKSIAVEELVEVAGERRWFETFKTPVLDEKGAPIGITGYSYDITERKRAHLELIRAKEEAESANKAKSTFLATMSHELRTPLNVINGMAAILAQENWPPEHKHAINLIAEGGHTLLSIIEEILDYSGLQAGKTKLEETPLSLITVASSALRLCAGTALNKDLNLTCWLDPKTPAELLGDPRRLHQVLVNLLNNAIKFTETGRVHLDLSVATLTPDTCALEFSVFDSGIGIAGDNLEKLFRPFSQADDSITRRFGGTGLGLAITKSFVNLMGGDIRVRSRLGMGSVFTFTVSLKTTTNRSPALQFLSAPVLQKRRALLLGQNGAQRRMLTTLLRAWGLEPVLLSFDDAAYPDLRYDIAILPLQAATDRAHPLSAWLACPERDQTKPVIWLGRRDVEAPTCCTGPAQHIGTFIDPAELSSALVDLLGNTGDAQRSDKPEKPKPLAETLPLSILAAEDNATNREVIKLVLRHLGYRVDLVENGAEAVAAAQHKKYDLLLLDMQMPVMDGLSAATEICRLMPDPAQRLKMVALTANALPGDRESCLAAGMDAYLSKPILPVDLQSCIRRIFDAGSSASPIATAKPASVAPVSWAERPLVDSEHLETITMGMTPEQILDTLRQLHLSVCTDYEATLPTVLELCERQSQSHFAETIHGLKGCFMMIGWSQVGTLCAESLTASRKGEFKDWPVFPDKLKAAFARSSTAMTAHLDELSARIQTTTTADAALSTADNRSTP